MRTRQTRRDITLVSTYTRDVVPLPAGGFGEMPGGPAHYIGEALNRLGRSYDVVTGERARVEVIRHVDGEEYVIPSLQSIVLPERFDSTAVILSPIVGEIDPLKVPSTASLLVVDLQGFVREPKVSSGDVTRTFMLGGLLRRADVVKASVEELERLSAQSRAALEQTCLVVTLGVEGALVRWHGTEVHVASRPVRTAITIGAGDTFLAAFVSAVLDGNNPVEAAGRAARFTEMVLAERVATGGDF